MIDAFTFDLPTKLYFGRKEEERIGEILKDYKATNVLLVYGQKSIIESGLLNRIKTFIKHADIEITELPGARPNPTIEFVREGIEIARLKQIDFILAIGGGSVMDAAKLISTGFYYDGDPFDISLKRYIPTKSLPLGVIVTIAASGSEMSTSCVVQDDSTGVKRGYNSIFNRPLFAIENPELTFSVPKVQTGYGIVDIIMHTLERYFSYSPSDDEPADALSEILIKKTLKAGLIAYNEPNNYDARANLLLYSSFSHNGLTSIGKKYVMPVHQLEHVLSGLYPFVAHGAGLAALFPAWARYYLEYDLDKFDRFAQNVFNLHHEDKKINAEKGLTELIDYFKKINMPLSFKELGIENPDIDKMVELLTEGGTRMVAHHLKPLDKEVARKIYSALQIKKEK